MTFKQKIIFIYIFSFFSNILSSVYLYRTIFEFIFFTDLSDCNYLILQFISAFNATFYKRKSRSRA